MSECSETSGYPDSNPKTVFGTAKPPLHFIPPVAILHLGQAQRNGGEKYGLMNWREKAISSSVYYDAAMRHLLAWWDGEDFAADSGAHHLAHVMACCALVLDGMEAGKLNDDRPTAGKFAEVVARMTGTISLGVRGADGCSGGAGADRAAQQAVEGVDKHDDCYFGASEPVLLMPGDRVFDKRPPNSTGTVFAVTGCGDRKVRIKWDKMPERPDSFWLPATDFERIQ